ncbi:MAG: hypothetical protein GY866_19805, partial [Proteobacteria bacterium]|nr:hypothetical protein [Pseudomonadota bacterium]
DLYQKIRNAGKLVHIFVSDPATVVPLLDRLGPAGVYLSVYGLDQYQAEDLLRKTEQYG